MTLHEDSYCNPESVRGARERKFKRESGCGAQIKREGEGRSKRKIKNSKTTVTYRDEGKRTDILW